MTEDDDDLYSDLPEESELAFLQLEDAFRQKLVTKTRQTQAPIDYMEYLNKTHAAAHALRKAHPVVPGSSTYRGGGRNLNRGWVSSFSGALSCLSASRWQ